MFLFTFAGVILIILTNMKTKKFFGALALAALVAGSPVALTSCDEDDVKTVLDIISLFTSGNELQGTAWISSDSSLAFEFTDSQNGNLYESSYADEQGAIAQPFTYTLDTENNKLTLVLSNGTRVYTIYAYTKGQSMTISYSGKSYKMSPITN